MNTWYLRVHKKYFSSTFLPQELDSGAAGHGHALIALAAWPLCKQCQPISFCSNLSSWRSLYTAELAFLEDKWNNRCIFLKQRWCDFLASLGAAEPQTGVTTGLSTRWTARPAPGAVLRGTLSRRRIPREAQVPWMARRGSGGGGLKRIARRRSRRGRGGRALNTVVVVVLLSLFKF